jgi:hypothetical protein
VLHLEGVFLGLSGQWTGQLEKQGEKGAGVGETECQYRYAARNMAEPRT